MRTSFFVLVGILPVVAMGVESESVLSLPVPIGINTEVSTNIPLHVARNRLGKVELKLQLTASPSNNVEIAVGADNDHDGDLSLEEADFTAGYDCGVWFYADTMSGVIRERAAPTSGRVCWTLSLNKRSYKDNWDMLKVVRRGRASFDELTIVTIDYPATLIIVR